MDRLILGRGAGSFVGGFLMKAYGTRVTFRILGVSAFCVAVFYFFFNRWYIIPKHHCQEKEKTAVPAQVSVKENGTDKENNDNGHVNVAFSEEKPNNAAA